MSDIDTGPDEDSDPARLTVAGDRLFLVADDGQHGRELWVGDGTGDGTHITRNIGCRSAD